MKDTIDEILQEFGIAENAPEDRDMPLWFSFPEPKPIMLEIRCEFNPDEFERQLQEYLESQRRKKDKEKGENEEHD